MTGHTPKEMTAEEFVAYLRPGSDQGGRRDDKDNVEIEVTQPVDFNNVPDFDFEKCLDIEGVRFREDVSLSNCRFGNNVKFRSCAFDRSLNLRKLAVGNGLSFTDCCFGVRDPKPRRLAILLDDAAIRGDLVFERTGVLGCISARRLRLAGSLEFTACMVVGKSSEERAAFDASDAKIKGSVIFEMGRLRPPSTTVASKTPSDQTARLQRSFFCDIRTDGASVLLRGAEVTDMVKLAWARFEGEVDLAFIKCRSLESEAGIFALPVGEARVANVSQKTIRSDEAFGGATIKGAITLSGGKFGLVHLHGISVSGAMMLIAGQSGQINIDDALYKGENDERFIATSRLGHFIMSSWRCRDFLSMHAVEVAGGSGGPSGFRGIVIKSSVIDRALSFWPGALLQRILGGYLEADCAQETPPKFFTTGPDGGLLAAESDPACRTLLNRWQSQLVVHGNIYIDHTTIGDDLVLTGVDVRENVGLSDGRIDILNSKIDGEVIFRSPISFLANSRMTAPILHLLARRIVVDTDGQLSVLGRAICHTLDMRGMEAKKVDLTGLCIREPPDKTAKTSPNPASCPIPQSTLNVPNATLSQIKVSGKVATFARLAKSAAKGIFDEISTVLSAPGTATGQPIQVGPLPQTRNWERELLSICFAQPSSIREPRKHRESSTHIPGALDFQHAEIGELVISDASFRDHRSKRQVTENGIVLDYAHISKLYVARSERDHANPHQHNGFPVPVSPADVAVKSWFLEDAGVHDLLQEPKSYIDKEATLAVPYLDLLDNDRVFRMSSYLAVEKSLRDRGYTEEARQIFIAGVYRDVRTKSAKGSKPRSESVDWRRGDGRLRTSVAPDWALASLFFVLLVAGAMSFGIGYLTKNFQLSVFCTAVVLIGIFALRANVFRLKRPWGEYVEFVVCAAWCIAAIYAIYVVAVFIAGASPFNFEALSVGLVFWLVLGIMMSGWLQRFVDQLYWSLVDYGTSAWRLAGVIFILMVISFALVSPAPQNFSPTLLAQSVPATQQKKPVTDAPVDWPFGARLWMTLRYHVPLVGAAISEEWEPADRPLMVVGASGCAICHFIYAHISPHWPTARDWYGFMMWMNWILWPLFLPFLIRTLSRER